MIAPALDESQVACVEIESADRQIVVAGPGSGKTEVVAALVSHLVSHEGLDPSAELLVISFSRAAVKAIDRRLRASDVQASGAVRTLDSLAQQIVREAFDEDLIGADLFDRRIRRSLEALASRAWDALQDIVHLVVDEVQDVVGLRAEFLLALIEALPPQAGFTLLGDPAQAIYDFQLTDEHPTPSSALLTELPASTGATVKSLTGSYRAVTRDAKAAVALRGLSSRPLEGVGDDVADFVAGLAPVNDESLAALATRQGEGLVVLTATNGQALYEALRLWREGVPVVVRRRAIDPVVDQWVAELLPARPNWSFDEFEAAVDDPEVAAERWRGLRSWLEGPARSLDTTRVSRRLRSRFIPNELLAKDPKASVVSTIHRAKGLEFDTVVLARYPHLPDEDPDQRSRIDYVAVTRARQRILVLERNPYPTILHRDSRTGRWLRSVGAKKRVKALEMTGADVERITPPGEDVDAAQEHLLTRVQVGDPLELKYDWTSTEVPRWSIRHEGVTVGRTTVEFGAHARSVLWGRIDCDLKDVHVECVETVAGDVFQEAPGGAGRHGLWLGVRPVGLACRVYKEVDA